MDTSETEEIRLGTELLELAISSTDNPEVLEIYNNILLMPGVDSALYMLYKAAEFAFSHPKPLLQSAFMFGKDEPDDTDWTEKARKEVLD